MKTLLPKENRYGTALKLVKVRGTERTAGARKAIVVAVRLRESRKSQSQLDQSQLDKLSTTED